MNICVFNKYKVHFINEYTYITDCEFGEISYGAGKEEWIKEMNGGELIDMIAESMLDNETINVTSSDRFVHITHFNTMNGTGAEIHFEYEEIK